MTLEEFKKNGKGELFKGIYNKQVYYFFKLGCGHTKVFNTSTGNVTNHFRAMYNQFKLLKENEMFTTKEQVLTAYKDGNEETKKLLLNLYSTQLDTSTLELIAKENEIAILKKQLENCGK
tara:strand:+ start:3084 stop:3443 length:360 start_codon:yes stop_codon:yes gene_type:complete